MITLIWEYLLFKPELVSPENSEEEVKQGIEKLVEACYLDPTKDTPSHLRKRIQQYMWSEEVGGRKHCRQYIALVILLERYLLKAECICHVYPIVDFLAGVTIKIVDELGAISSKYKLEGMYKQEATGAH